MTSLSSRELQKPPNRRKVNLWPLIVLCILSVVALVVGIVVSRYIASTAGRPAAVQPSASPANATDALCRPPVAPASQEPWIDGDGSAEAAWRANGEALSQNYIVGPNGWIFWNDLVEEYASQAVGRSFLTRDEAQRWHDYYASVRDGLAAEGIDFYITIVPSTTSIYPEQLPEFMYDLRGSTIMDQFMAVAGDLPVIDIREPLIEEAKQTDDHLYSWSNSHWTDYGAYVGWTHIADCVNAMLPEREPLRVPAIDDVEIIGDFNEWESYGVESPGEDWASPVYSEEFPDVTITDQEGTSTVPWTTQLGTSTLPATTSVDESWTGQSALIIRDSLGSGLSPFWQQAYSPTWQYLHEYRGFDTFPDYRELIAEHDPDVVVLQLAERHLVNVPPSRASF